MLVGVQNNGRVVALATGHATVNPQLVDEQGRVLKDVHCEVIARRALLKLAHCKNLVTVR